jgi:hypothetical protein
VVWGTRGEDMKITIDGANLKGLKVFLYERVHIRKKLRCDEKLEPHYLERYSCNVPCGAQRKKLFDLTIYKASKVFKKCYIRFNLIYKKFISGIEIAETLIIHPIEGV